MHAAPIIALAVWSTLIGVADVRHRRIPNVLTLPATVTALLWMGITGHCLLGGPWTSGLLAGAFGLAVTLPAYAIGKLGAGDAKFLLAIGLLTGWDTTAMTFVIASFLAVCLAVLWWVARDAWIDPDHPWLHQTIIRVTGTGAHSGQLRLPYGTLLAIGLMVALF